MTDHFVIDRRKNPKGKSLGNRQRFIRRAKGSFVDRLRKKATEKNINDSSNEEITIPSDDISEPEFSYDHTTGDSDFVLPGNDEFIVGDTIEKPRKGEGKGSGKEGSPDGEGEDSFAFSLTREEYLNIIFDGLELPNLKIKGKKDVTIVKNKRAGFSNQGCPANLNVEESMIRSLGRRIALKFPKRKKIKELQEQLDKLLAAKVKDTIKIAELERKIESLKKQAAAIPFIDPVDLRYNAFTKEPQVITSAVMICLMDVSASMEEAEKMMAKRFYLLLYLFLERNYKKVDIVFVRHHTKASECTEQEFFHSKETGGTEVSSGLNLINQIIKDRYSPEENNIYICQTTDGDNYRADNTRCLDILQNEILPIVQGYFYIEVHPNGKRYNYFNDSASSDLWDMMLDLEHEHSNVICDEILSEDDVLHIFRHVFQKECEK